MLPFLINRLKLSEARVSTQEVVDVFLKRDKRLNARSHRVVSVSICMCLHLCLRVYMHMLVLVFMHVHVHVHVNVA